MPYSLPIPHSADRWSGPGGIEVTKLDEFYYPMTDMFGTFVKKKSYTNLPHETAERKGKYTIPIDPVGMAVLCSFIIACIH